MLIKEAVSQTFEYDTLTVERGVQFSSKNDQTYGHHICLLLVDSACYKGHSSYIFSLFLGDLSLWIHNYVMTGLVKFLMDNYVLTLYQIIHGFHDPGREHLNTLWECFSPFTTMFSL